MTLDSKLIILRKRHRFSQFEIAEKLDVSQGAYFKWEAGKSKPKTNNLQKIAAFYDVDMSVLLDNNKITGSNNIINESSTTIQVSKNFLKTLLQKQENITKMLEMLLK